ncbi:MAG: cobalt transporter [Gammaproteobacteria bacterium]|nr:cobalt transporter [Gammaproteobacteria bacterium]
MALASGASAGLILTLLHQVLTVPLILEAERFEVADVMTHETPAWAPQAGVQRLAATALSDVLAGVGFALLLAAVWLWRDQPINVWQGLLWGLGGFAALTLAPAAGLPAALPGSAVAALAARQWWWVGTALASATGLAALVFLPSLGGKLVGVGLIAIPHLAGAPQPLGQAAVASQVLGERFAQATLLSSAIFWCVLGVVGAWSFQRYVRAPANT